MCIQTDFFKAGLVSVLRAGGQLLGDNDRVGVPQTTKKEKARKRDSDGFESKSNAAVAVIDNVSLILVQDTHGQIKCWVKLNNVNNSKLNCSPRSAVVHSSCLNRSLEYCVELFLVAQLL